MLYSHERITHQKQPTIMACVATCLAMLVKEDAIYVDAEFSKQYSKGAIDVPAYLGGFGVCCTPWLSAGIHALSDDKIYLATVPSLQLPGLFHQIVIDTRFGQVEVFDPCKGIPSKLHYEFNYNPEDPTSYPLRSFIIDYEIKLPVRHCNGQSGEGLY